MEQTPYEIRPAAPSDMPDLVRIYNSNPSFLVHHLGSQQVDEDFLRREQREMEAMGFLSCVVVERRTGERIGVLDYHTGETVYLSLLMLDGGWQGDGLGAVIYRQLEGEMARRGAQAIRIDVVDDYAGNVTPFWEKQGFTAQGRVQLDWGDKRSDAAMMVKALRKGSTDDR